MLIATGEGKEELRRQDVNLGRRSEQAGRGGGGEGRAVRWTSRGQIPQGWKLMGCEGWQEGGLYLSRNQPGADTRGRRAQRELRQSQGHWRTAPVMLSKPGQDGAAIPGPAKTRLLNTLNSLLHSTHHTSAPLGFLQTFILLIILAALQSR